MADKIYVLSGNSWILKNHWITRALIHEGGRFAVGLMVMALLPTVLASCFLERWQYLRRGLLYLLISVLSCGILINLLKQITHIDCPWDLLRYGGELPYIRNFERHPQTFQYGACFPAGHASAAYSWFGLYYFARECAPRWRGRILTGVIIAGLVFGIAQQLRGAHFLSHDLWTAGICWFLSTGIYLMHFPGHLKQGPET